MSNEKFKVKFGLAVGDTQATIDGTNGNIATNGSLSLNGSSSGSVTLTAGTTPAAQTYTLPTAYPAVTGYVLSGTTGGALSWVDNATGVTSVTGSGHITASPTTGAVVVSTDATDANTASTIVSRDASGNFSAGTVTANSVAVAYSGASSLVGSLNVGGAQNGSADIGIIASFVGASPTYAYTSLQNKTTGAASYGAYAVSNDLGTVYGELGMTSSTYNYASAGFPNNAFSTPNTTFLQSGANSELTLGTIGSNSIHFVTNGGTQTTEAMTISPTNAVTMAGTLGVTGAVTSNSTTIGASVGTVSTSSGNLTVNTANGTTSGSMVITAGVNGAITITPNGTGNLALTASNGGNLTNTRNYVFGAIRNATTQSIGDIWALNSTGTVQPFRGISLDNSADTTKLPGYLARSYSNTAGFRGRLIFERARGTAASPTAVQAGDFLGEVDATGYTSTGWLNDNIITGNGVPAFFGFTATENWVSNTNIGTQFGLTLAPTATTITSGANLVPTLSSSPQSLVLRGDAFSIAQGKTVAFTATGCSTSGTTLTIGTVTSGTVAIGNVLQTTNNINGLYIVANIGGSGSGSTWTLSGSPGTLSGQPITGNAGFIGSVPATSATLDILQSMRLISNTIKSSDGTTNITTSTTNTSFALPVGFPVKTAAAWNAITGAVGQQVSVSDSPVNAGKMAYWDTTNSRWSYIDTNLAI